MNKTQKIYTIAAACISYINRMDNKDSLAQYPLAEKSVNRDYDKLQEICELLDSAGWDNTKFNIEKSKDTCIRFNTQYHIMNDNGFYCGWLVISGKISASLEYGYKLNISLQDGNRRIYNDYADYLQDTIQNWLDTEIERY